MIFAMVDKVWVDSRHPVVPEYSSIFFVQTVTLGSVCRICVLRASVQKAHAERRHLHALTGWA